MSQDRRFLIVANPVARRGTDQLIDTIQRNAPPMASFDLVYTRPDPLRIGEIKERAEGCEAVIAIGGDGTVADAVTGIDSPDIPIGILGAGSTNIVARTLGLPGDSDAAARLIFARPHTRKMDLGVCNERRFIHMGGAGFDSRIFAATSKRLKRYFGWVAYLQGASQTLFSPAVKFKIDVDGTSLETESSLVLVANGGSIIRPSFPITPGIRYDDGFLDVIVITATRPVQIASAVGRFATRSLDRSPYTIHIRGRNVTVESSPAIALQLDGDIIGLTPGRFSLLPGALQVIVPH